MLMNVFDFFILFCVCSIIGVCDFIILVLYVILGDRMFLDLVRIMGWKNYLEGLFNGKLEVCYVVLFIG